jgi:predicted transposase YdaD
MESKTGARWIKEWQSKAKAEGKVEGRAEGEAEGKAEAFAQVVRNLKSSGMSNKLISQYTGLSLAKVKKTVIC